MASRKSSRKTSREAERAAPDPFRVIAEYTYDWETWIDARGRTRWINSAVERITGYTVAQCLARKDHLLSLAHTADRARVRKVLQSAAAGEAGNDVEFRVRCKDGRARWVAVSWQAMRDASGKSLGYRTSVRDIHDRKRMERQVDSLRRKAERAANARSELLANVSHELRSPAHCIAGFSQLLLASELTPRERRHVQVIADQATMMQRQVEDLLQVAALDVAPVRFEAEPFDLHALLDSLLDALDLEALHTSRVQVERAITLDSPWVVGDRVRVAQVVRNLLDNALKFTAEGTIRLSAARALEGLLQIDVRDTGVGMTAAQLEQVTQPFYQADSRSVRRHGGVGLGLSIVERLVHAMGGQLELGSRRHRGTHVRVTLPLPATASPGVEAKTNSSELAPGTALVADDSAVARELMVEWLRSLGWQAVTAASGVEALALARQRPFDAVLLDYQMPELDGAQTALALRRILARTRRRVPVLLITANAFAQRQLGSARSAIDQVLVKPLTRDDLRRALVNDSPAPPLPQRARPDTRTDLLDMTVVGELMATPSRKASSLLAYLLPKTIAEQAEALGMLQQALDARDRDQIERATHRVAGVAATVGARGVVVPSRGLMQDVHKRSFRFDRAASTVAQIRERWGQALAELQSLSASD
jgi:PAS domain S-box-containing protein